ncbi:glycosyltransferase family 2 protein [Singulisphaera sp. PoT]|uniref:glycosyltransferase family 2 protein n=1 Tax=Singulisphaera sp. PoT TaxID=3411797 RepID=UPI003BF4C069
MISVVVPVRNEQESLATLHSELAAVASDRGFAEAEWIFIDDGSTDGSWREIRRLAEHDSRVRAIKFRRNFGKAAALTAGFQAARGEIVFTLDGDLQDDPKEMPRFLERLDEGYDLVSGWKRTRHDPWHKVFPSRVFNAMVSAVTGCKLHDHNCGYKAYRRDVTHEVRIYGELHRFVPALAHARGFRVAEIEVHHRARRFGYSKYGVARFLKGFLDLLSTRFLTVYSQRPAHILGGLGLGLSVLGKLGLLAVVLKWLIGGMTMGTLAFLVFSSMLVVVGVQIFCAGLLAELTTSYLLRPRETFSVSERIEVDGLLPVENLETSE